MLVRRRFSNSRWLGGIALVTSRIPLLGGHVLPGVPTTRALSLITTGEDVVRDMLYDGNAAPEKGAVVCRLSSSFVRFGHFQMLAARQELALLKAFTDFVIQREFPALDNLAADAKGTYIAWFEEVCHRTADLMVHWMRVGFVHGVMNTDNMSIIGETIDYGPYGWLEGFDPNWTPNTTDAASGATVMGSNLPSVNGI